MLAHDVSRPVFVCAGNDQKVQKQDMEHGDTEARSFYGPMYVMRTTPFPSPPVWAGGLGSAMTSL